MTVADDFTVFILNPNGLPDPALAVAGSRAGAVGVLNAENGMAPAEMGVALRRLALPRKPYGLKWGGLERPAGWQDQSASKPSWLILDAGRNLPLLTDLQPYRAGGGRILLELAVWRDELALLEDQIDGWWVKGHEAGGVVGEESTFVLLQRLLARTGLPVYARGGIGLHSAAACRIGGAAGVVLDNQLLLLQESPLAEALRPWLRGLDGTETVLVGREETAAYGRVLERPGFAPVRAWRQRLLENAALDPAESLDALIGWRDPLEHDILPLGQDCAFAAPWAKRYRTVAGVLRALRQAGRADPAQARRDAALGEDAPLARAHGTRFPLVQGAMTRVSDRPEFAEAVAAAGALPMIALALLGGDRARKLLEETQQRMAQRPWGVGILGFVPAALREQQLAAIRAVRPPFAYIAGGRPEQARQLEADGILTYLHVPTPTLLQLFLEQGARRFIFEGRECGGHIGPLSSLVLWESAVEALLAHGQGLPDGLKGISILLAGGLHDARSAAMAATLAAPLTGLGAHIGLLMGTAYILTEEAVRGGAIRSTFQQVALNCGGTATLTTGPGHASRCAVTPFVAAFHEARQQLQQQGGSARLVRDRLDELTLGRLRLATKGLLRADANGELRLSSNEEQWEQGMYMIGQVAALHDRPLSLAQLHHNVTAAALTWLNQTPSSDPVRQGTGAGPADVAIIGIGVWLPGATDTRGYWRNLVDGVDCLQQIPSERWDWRLYYAADPAARDRIYAKWGGFIAEQPFDPTRYGLPPVALKSVDPLQLLTLETVRQALTDAQIALDQVDRERIAVVLGTTGGLGELGLSYATRADLPRAVGAVDQTVLARLPEWTEDSFAGLLPNVAAGRVSNRFDFGGINCAVDAACASSLAAIYHGVNELRLGHSDLVISGGVDTMQSPFMYLCFAKTQALSPQGRPRTFDEKADGIAIAEGVAAVVLKRLADAERDGDRIYAVIKGIAGSSDGRAKGLTAPRPAGQLRALRRAYQEAGYSPATVGLWEAHGTGTVAGDQAELETVTTLLAEVGAPPASGVIGSVKSLIGHTKATAGVAGLVKAALALHYRVLPPHRGVNQPLGPLRETSSPLFISTEARPWLSEAGRPRRASVSAFGFGGTNFHATLEAHGDDSESAAGAPLPDWPVELFVWRAADTTGLFVQLQRLQAALEAGAQPRLPDLAAGLAPTPPTQGRTLAIVAGSLSELRLRIAEAVDLLQGKQPSARSEAVYLPKSWAEMEQPNRLAVLFPGQGSQYPDMLRELAVALPPLRATLERADALLREVIGGGHADQNRLSAYIYPPNRFTPAALSAARARLTRTEIAQPALGAVEAGLWAWLKTLNLRPDLAAGHSYGEYVALHAAGVFDQDSLLRLSEARGRFIVEAAAGGELGTMLAAGADVGSVQKALAGIPAITLANYNAPRQLVLSGTAAAIGQARQALTDSAIAVTPLNVAAAFHSPVVEPARARLAAFMSELPFQSPAFTVYGNATAAAYPAQPAAIRDRLAAHLTEPVNFTGEIEAMYAAGARLFLEVGPRDVLTRLTRQILGERPHLALAVEDRGGGLTGLLHALAALLANGVGLDLTPLFAGRVSDEVALDRLLEQSYPAPLPAHGWLLSGNGVRRPHQPAALGTKPFLTADDMARQPMPLAPPLALPEIVPSLESNAMSDQLSGPPLTSGPGGPWTADQALAGYQETMRQFLQLQERVMLAYFAASGEQETGDQLLSATPSVVSINSPPAVPVPLPIAPPVAPVAPATSLSPAPVQPLSPAPIPPALSSTVAVATSEEQSVAPAALKSLLLKIVSERTGYPQEMLGLDQDIEADLGIDSIKRVEILGLFRRSLPAVVSQTLQPHMEDIASLHTFEEILDAVAARLAVDNEVVKPAVVAGEGVRPFESTGTGFGSCAPLSRYIVKAHAKPLPALPAVLEPGLYLLTPDDLGVADALSRKLRQAGVQPMLVPEEVLDDAERLPHWLDAQWRGTAIRGVIHLLPLGRPPLAVTASLAEWRERIGLEVKTLFDLLRLVGPELRDHGRLLTVSGLGGQFGRTGTADPDLMCPGGGGLTGLAKTLNLEWNTEAKQPGFIAKAVDLDPGDDPEQLAGWVLQELALPGGRREIGYPAGARTIFRTIPSSLSPLIQPLRQPDQHWVVLATGGARGITAETLRDLAACRLTLVLLGRSPLPGAEESALQDLPDATALRGYFVQQSQAGGGSPRPVEIERRVRAVLRDRETRANLADFAALGARVDYRALDVRDEAALAGLLEELYTQHGRIDAVIHGAGVIEDGWLLDKSRASIDRVIDTKVIPAFLLAKHLRPETLKFVAFYTSVAGRFGNRGQADYATANEILGRLASGLARHWGGQVKVAAINWSPWDRTTHGVGMVTPEVRRQFEARGVQLVNAAAGRQFVWRELLYGPVAQVELVAGDFPWEYEETRRSALPGSVDPALITSGLWGLLYGGHFSQSGSGQWRFDKTVDVVSDCYLDQHRLDGIPVVPFAMALEYMAEAVAALTPDADVLELEDVRLLRGLRLLEDDLPLQLNLKADAAAAGPRRFDVTLGAVDASGKPSYRATVKAGRVFSEKPPPPLALNPSSTLVTAADAYRRWLFHGPLLQSISAIEALDPRGFDLLLTPSRVERFCPFVARGQWLIDPAIIDALFQGVLVWSRQWRDSATLPTRIGLLQRFSREPLPDQLTAYVRIHSELSNPVTLGDAVIVDLQKVPRLAIWQFECTASPALNRLGGGWAGGIPSSAQ